MTPTLANLAAAVRAMRTSRGVSQMQLAKLIGMSPGAINKIELGKCALTTATMNAITAALSYQVVIFFDPLDRERQSTGK